MQGTMPPLHVDQKDLFNVASNVPPHCQHVMLIVDRASGRIFGAKPSTAAALAALAGPAELSPATHLQAASGRWFRHRFLGESAHQGRPVCVCELVETTSEAAVLTHASAPPPQSAPALVSAELAAPVSTGFYPAFASFAASAAATPLPATAALPFSAPPTGLSAPPGSAPATLPPPQLQQTLQQQHQQQLIMLHQLQLQQQQQQHQYMQYLHAHQQQQQQQRQRQRPPAPFPMPPQQLPPGLQPPQLHQPGLQAGVQAGVLSPAFAFHPPSQPGPAAGLFPAAPPPPACGPVPTAMPTALPAHCMPSMAAALPTAQHYALAGVPPAAVAAAGALPPACLANAAACGPRAPAVGLAADVRWDMYQQGATAYYMEAGDPNPVVLTPPPAAAAAAAEAGAAADVGGVRLGLVCMTKRPADLRTWLTYHHEVVGVTRFYLRVEDTPELAELFSSAPWDSLVCATFASGTERDYFLQMDRQINHITNTLPQARLAGLTNLIHIDDDELLYCPSGVKAFLAELAAAPPERPDLHMCNVEALLPSATCESPFKDASAFRHFPTKYCSYTNGKSIANLGCAQIRAHGPHNFRTDVAIGGGASSITHMVPPHVAAVLHYESCTYKKWEQKYIDLARRHGADAEVYARMPFAFYRESIRAAHKLLAARALNDAAAEAAAELEAHTLWSTYKMAPPNLPSPSASGPIVLPQGITVLNPFLSRE